MPPSTFKAPQAKGTGFDLPSSKKLPEKTALSRLFCALRALFNPCTANQTFSLRPPPKFLLKPQTHRKLAAIIRPLPNRVFLYLIPKAPKIMAPPNI